MILTGHLLRELLATLVIVTAVLLLASVGARFIEYVADVAQGEFALVALWQLLALRVPLFAQLVLPLSLFLAILLTLGRAYSDLEVGAMHAGGASPMRVFAIVMLVVVPTALCVGAMSLWLAPASAARLQVVIDEQRRLHDFDLVAPRRFMVFGDQRRVSYVDAVGDAGRQLHGVFIAERLPTARGAAGAGTAAPSFDIIWAATGVQRRNAQSGVQYLELRNGHRYRGSPGSADFVVFDFTQLGQRLPLHRALAGVGELRAQPTDALRSVQAKGATLVGENASTYAVRKAKALAEWQWRWALPVFTLVAGALAVAIGRVRPRHGRFARIAPGMTLFLCYLGLLFLGRDALDRGAALAVLGLGWAHLPFVGVAGYLLFVQQRRVL